jgi:predicted enzyme related to lactoylglutathione lyase
VAEFYRALFGWQLTTDDQLDYVMFAAAAGLGGGFPRPQEPIKAGVPIVYVQTDDIAATLTTVSALGGSVVSPAFEVPGVGGLAFSSTRLAR